jgi:hypothetical protein
MRPSGAVRIRAARAGLVVAPCASFSAGRARLPVGARLRHNAS